MAFGADPALEAIDRVGERGGAQFEQAFCRPAEAKRISRQIPLVGDISRRFERGGDAGMLSCSFACAGGPRQVSPLLPEVLAHSRRAACPRECNSEVSSELLRNDKISILKSIGFR